MGSDSSQNLVNNSGVSKIDHASAFANSPFTSLKRLPFALCWALGRHQWGYKVCEIAAFIMFRYALTVLDHKLKAEEHSCGTSYQYRLDKHWTLLYKGSPLRAWSDGRVEKPSYVLEA